jgi:hypothetical protein
MKKFTFIALMMVVLASCGDRITEITEVTEITETVELFTYTRTITVNRENWKKIAGDDNNPGAYHYFQIEEPELTDYIFDNGVMQAFLYYSADNSDTLSPLPYSDFVSNGNTYFGEEHFTVEFQPGWVTFMLKTDYNTGLPYYDSYDFMIRFLW